MSLLKTFLESKSLAPLLKVKHTNLQLSGLNESALAIAAALLFTENKRDVLLVADKLDTAEKLRDDLDVLLKDQLAFFPNDELLPFDTREANPAIISLRIETLFQLSQSKQSIVVCEARSLARKLVSPKAFKQQVLHLEQEKEIDFEHVIETLDQHGFTREDTVEKVGTFSVRGGIIDVYPWTQDDPIRIEFYGDEIESMRTFDLVSQRSIKKVDAVDIYSNIFDQDGESSLLDYLDQPIIFQYEPELIAERLRLHEQEAIDHLKTHEKDQTLFEKNYFSADQWQKMISDLQQIVYQSKQIKGFESVKLKLSSQRLFDGKIKTFINYLKDNQTQNIKTIVLCDNQGLKDRFIEILDEYEIPLPEIHIGAFHHDLSLSADKVEIINEHQIFKRFKRRKAYKKFKRAEALRALNTLSYGDFIVHVDFGIGRFVGLHVIQVNQAEKECLKIEYQGKDYVYVGIDRIQRIQKYVSEDGVVPKLTKLGGKEWDRLRSKTKKQVEAIAKELVELYAERSMSQGHAFSQDANWQHELEASFEFEDTADQKKATEDLKKDMESSTPMDRLVCGDVGFGKTEIAIRAAFKAAVDSKQVAILVPTTILAQQHFETFSQRLANFPVKVDLLSRFRTAAQQKKTIGMLKAGEVDIIVGTHRLLSEDIAFKDLGLIIVDEEQRFGVKNKEKLKELKRGVDVLTLTATPIPRTLHQSLVGIRGISNIETAPVNRLPILTEIVDWDEDKIYTAIIREMDRGGQVFFVHNRVQTIDEIYSLVSNIVPKARIAIGHGQMKERELEQVMIDFKNHKYDILLATMIIENGLDIPNANTILINHAERFGLAQLYQLRGRVGRSDHQAYAYLIAPKMHTMTGIALKRLHAIEEFSELGSGIKISMRDLEIRGAGSLLGHQQSGHIEAVGYEMYLEILEETVQELKEKQGEIIAENKKVKSSDTQFDVDIDSLLPDSFIHNPHERMNLYHRLAKCKNDSELNDLIDEITDRFGQAPASALVLYEMFRLRNLATQLFIINISIRKLNMSLAFSEDVGTDDTLIQAMISKFLNQDMTTVNFSQAKGFGVNVQLNGDVRSIDKVQFARSFLEKIL